MNASFDTAAPEQSTALEVELAPRHKLGLSLNNPVLLAAGVVGYGDAITPGLELAALGGFVTAPVTRRPRHGHPPELAEVEGGVLWSRGAWNPGVRRVMRDHAGLWRRSSVPVIVHVAGRDAADLAAVASALEEAPGIAGLELDAPLAGSAEEAAELMAGAVWAVREAADLPILVRLPLYVADVAVQAVVEAGADALVLAQPPAGLHFDAANGRTQRGNLHGPGLAPQIAARITDLAAWMNVPLVACGGVHCLGDALLYLSAGAVALQVDTAVWVDPGLPGRIAAALAGRQADGLR